MVRLAGNNNHTIKKLGDVIVTKQKMDRESLLMALDQLDQTMDVMRQVVNRLKHNLETKRSVSQHNQESAEASTPAKAIVLH